MNEELKIIITAATKGLQDAVDDAKDKIKGFKEQVEKAGEAVDENLANAGEAIDKGMKKAAVGIAAASAALLALGASTTEYRQNQAKLLTAFEAAGGGAEDASKAYNDLYRVLGDDGQATEAAAHLAQLSTNEKELSEWTTICQGVYATFGDSLPIESLTEAANETAKTGALTGALADALNWAGISEDAFQESLDACNTEAEREALIRETLNGKYTEAAALYEKNNADVLAQNEAQASLNEVLAQLGATMQPVITQLTQIGAELLEKLTPAIQNLTETVVPVLMDLLGGLLSFLAEILGFLFEHEGILITLASAIAAIIIAIKLYNAVQAIKNAMDAAGVATVWGLVAAHAAQAVAAMAAIAPYLLIVAAIAAVIAIIVLCITYWDEIVAAVKWAIDGIVSILSTIASWIYDYVIAPIGRFFSMLWDGIVSVFSKVGEFFKNAFLGAVNGIKSVFSGIVSFFSGVWNKITGIFSKVGTAIATAIKTAVFSAINGVLFVAVNIINGFIKAINGAISLINLIPGVEIGKLNMLSVPKLAKGGIVDSATLAVVGEEGKEAVMPLENNTEWIDMLAGKLTSLMGGNAPIILQVDGKTFAQISVDSINQLTRQRGKLPLVLA